MNIVDAILFQCRINADAVAISVPGGKLHLATYGQLERMMHNISRRAADVGLKPGSIVGILAEDRIFHIALMLGLMRLGVIPVSCRGPRLPKELAADAVVTDAIGRFENAGRVIQADFDWAVGGDGRPLDDARVHRPRYEDVCKIIMTSGSTGTPKCVALTHRLVVEKNARLDYRYGPRWPRSTRLYCDLGVTSGPAFRYIVYSLMRGGAIVLHADDVAETALALGLYKIDNMMTSPRGLEQHLKFFQAQSLFRCELDHIVVSGGMLSNELAIQARACMSHNIITSYGATETGAVASADSRVIADVPGAVGHVLPGSIAEIVDQAGRLLPAGAEGTVRVRTSTMANGYVGDPEQTRRSFRDGFFYPGDVGYLTKDGLLAITGREQTRLNVGGDKINPESIEAALISFAGVADAAAFTVANELGVEEIYALIVAPSAIDEQALRAHCEQSLTRAFTPARFITVDRIPRNQMNKIERAALHDLAIRRLH